MAFLVWFMVICMVLVLIASIFKPDMIRYFSRNDRVRKATSNARDNVRITNIVSNTVYRPDTRTPLGGNRSLYRMISIAPPIHVLEVELSETAFKQSPNSVFDSGVSRMRIAVDGDGKAVEAVATKDIGIVSDNPVLSPVEMDALLEATEQKLVDTEGELMEEKANAHRIVEDTVGHVQDLTRSKTQQNRPRS